MATDLHDLSIAELSRLIAARKLSPVDLVEALIQRIEQYDGQTRAFITRTFDLARQQARRAEAEIAAGPPRGPLHGIPFALKDIYDTQGILTSAHSRIFIDRDPRRGRHGDHPALRRGRGAARQAGHPRDGARRAVVRPAVAARAQPVEPRPLHRRLVLGLGGGRRGGHGPGGARLRHRGIDPRAGIALRRRRADAHVRPGEPRGRHHQLVHVRPLRPAGAHRRGLRAAAGGPGRLRPEGRGQPAAADPPLSRGARPGSARPPDRRASPPLGGRHPGLRGRPHGRWTPRSTCCAGSAPSSRSAACARWRATSTSRSSSPRARSSASTSRA